MSLGKDLASIRKSQNLTLEDIQNAVKIPLNTLKSIENGSIFDDPTKNNTYIRSFVRSYAKVLKIEDEEIVQALDEMEAGSYSGSLISDTQQDFPGSDYISKREEGFSEPDEDDLIKTEPDTKAKKPTQKPVQEVETINWADMGRKFTTAGKSSRVWIFVVLFVVVGALAGSGYYFWEDLSTFISPENISATQPQETEQSGDPIIPTPLDSAQVTEDQDAQTDAENTSETDDDSPGGPIELGDTLTISVYAAYGQLEPIRVTSDLNWRTNPFWMEQGESYYFDFRDTLLVRGQYSRLLLLFNGHVIENPRQNYFNPAFNSIMITRSVLNQPQYLATPPEEFPLQVGPPDSTVYRIRF